MTAGGVLTLEADSDDTGGQALSISANIIGTTANLRGGGSAGAGSNVSIDGASVNTLGHIVVDQGGALVLNNNLSATNAGSNITVSAAIPLNVDTSSTLAATGTVTINQSVSGVGGGETLDIDGATINLPVVEGPFLTGLDLDASTTAVLNGNIETNGTVDFSGSAQTDLPGAVSITTSGDDIIFNGTTLTDSAASALTIITGGGAAETVSFGTVTLNDVGSSLSITSASGIDLYGTMTVDGDISFTGADAGDTVDLLAAVSITSTNGDIDFGTGNDVNINGGQTLSVTGNDGTNGTVTLAGIGNSTPVTQLTVSGNVVTLEGVIHSTGADGAMSITEAGTAGDTLTVGGTVTGDTNTITLSGTGVVDINAAVEATVSTVTATADSDNNNAAHELQIGANVRGTTVTFQTGGATAPVVVDGATTNGLGGTDFVTAAGAEIRADVSAVGTVDFSGLSAASRVDVDGARSIGSTGGNVDFRGVVLESDAGAGDTAALSVGNGILYLEDVGTQNSGIDGLTITDAQDVDLSGSITVEAGGLSFANVDTGETIVLTGAVGIDTSADGGAVNFDDTGITGAQTLVVNAGAGTVTLNAALGGTADITSLDLDAGVFSQGAGGTVDASGLIEIDVAGSFNTGATVTSTGGDVRISCVDGLTVDQVMTAGGVLTLEADSDDTGGQALSISAN
ncbi:MAG: hypothetical protein GY867_10060, partial [bacterium]|nr:hypothetical protein [bacterium]